MKILFTSDLHGYLKDFQKFAYTLKSGKYDCGVIAGDLLDDGVSDGELEEYFSDKILNPDDFIPELPDADLSHEEAMEAALQKLHSKDHPVMRALYYKERKVKDILVSAGKPVFVVPGNHDMTEWEDFKNVVNVHDRKIQFGKYNLVGYKWTRLHRTEEDHYRDIQLLKKIVNRRTILITHEPPYGIMDGAFNMDGDRIHLGSHEIRMLVERRKPKLHLFGHTHSNYGIQGKFVNGSYPAVQQFFSIDTKGSVRLLRDEYRTESRTVIL